MATLQAFDTAILIASDAENRAGLAEQVHPAKPFRDAAQVCEQEAAVSSPTSLWTRKCITCWPLSTVLSLIPPAPISLKTTLRDYRLGGVDRDDRDAGENPPTAGRPGKNWPAVRAKYCRGCAETAGEPLRSGRASGRFQTFAPRRRFRQSYAGYRQHRLFSLHGLLNQRAGPKGFLRSLPAARLSQKHRRMAQLLQKRYELANVLGYPDWAAYITANKMVETEQNAADFIEKITAAAQIGSKRDYEELLAFKKQEDPKAESVNAWDVSHLVRGAKIKKFGYDAQVMRPYFEYSRVLQGILDITSKMYGISYKPVTDAQVWHPEVTVYDVFDHDNRIGRIYFDMFPRENKYKHYATFTLATAKDGVRLPEYVLVCNFPRATGQPGLMERDDVVTFFHEFGHLVHGIMRGNTKWATGDLENDFIEAPSQMFEEWPRDPTILRTFARHYQTNEPIPVELAEKARAADDFGRALNVRQQMFYAAISLDFYNRNPQGLDQDKLVAELQTRYTPYQFVPGTHMQTAFDHLNGYSAVYYTYMWSLVIAKDMFTEFKKNGLMNPRSRGEVSQLGAGSQRDQASRGSGPRFPGTSVLVRRVCRLVEWEVAGR